MDGCLNTPKPRNHAEEIAQAIEEMKREQERQAAARVKFELDSE